jgi:hypothetical protein
MRHWKFLDPIVPGAVTLNVKVLDCPGAMASPAAKLTRFDPHVVLSWRFCDPSLYPAAAVQVLVPELRIVTDTEYTKPAVIDVGTDWLTKSALFV